MKYNDPMYGLVYFPDFVERLAQSPLLQRLKLISLDSAPQGLQFWKVPSRFEHSLGTCFLALKVLENNPRLHSLATLLPVAALLHDAGNPPFSHLSEPFLKTLTGKDGESFLSEMLAGSETEKVLRDLKLEPKTVVDFVTGRFKPISLVLNGSLDIDNIDNVSRYWHTTAMGETLFNPLKLASAFRFDGSDWQLQASSLVEATHWQTTRQAVYGLVYSYPHLCLVMMIYRGLYLAFSAGQITREFFRLADGEALDHLNHCSHSRNIVEKVVGYQWYQEVFSHETTQPTGRLKVFCRPWNVHSFLADHLAEQMNLPLEAVCAYVGKGRDHRRIAIPFVENDGIPFSLEAKQDPIYRVKVYLDPEWISLKGKIRQYLTVLV